MKETTAVIGTAMGVWLGWHIGGAAFHSMGGWTCTGCDDGGARVAAVLIFLLGIPLRLGIAAVGERLVFAAPRNFTRLGIKVAGQMRRHYARQDDE